MRVGLIAEGPADLAVLTPLVTGVLDLCRADLHYLRPQDVADETDLHRRDAATFSNWEIVREECCSRARIDEFLNSPVIFEGDDDRRLVVVQIDTAECSLPNFGVARPPRKAANAPELLLDRVRARVAEWLGGNVNRVVRAVAVEETDAWVLALHAPGDTAGRLDAKNALLRYARQHLGLTGAETPRHYAKWAGPFRKRKEREAARAKNLSLDRFVFELEAEVALAVYSAGHPPS